MLELRNVCKVYQNSDGEKTALKNINFKSTTTGLTFLVGPSGSGKTTMLNILAGLDSPTSGQMLVSGVDIRDFRGHGLNGYRNRCIGVVYQDCNLLDHLTLRGNTELALELQQKKPEEGEIENLFKRLGIAGLEHRFPNEVSGGEQQRAAIARVLVKKPQILITDELTSSLDLPTRHEIYKILKELSKDILIIASTHSKEMTERFADRVVTFDDGIIKSDIMFGDDRSNTVEFVGGDVIAVEPGATLTATDVEKINTLITGGTKSEKKPVYICIERDLDKLQKNHPAAAKQITAAMKQKLNAKSVQRTEKFKQLEEYTPTGEFKYETARLPLSVAWNLSIINFGSNKLRTAASILLGIFALSFFAITSSMQNIGINYIAIALGVLAACIMASFIAQSVRAKRKNIAIIRSMGIRTYDIVRIFILEAAILSFLVALGSWLCTHIFTGFGNLYYRTYIGGELFNPSLLFYAITLSAAVAVIFAVYIISALIIARNKPTLIRDIRTRGGN